MDLLQKLFFHVASVIGALLAFHLLVGFEIGMKTTIFLIALLAIDLLGDWYTVHSTRKQLYELTARLQDIAEGDGDLTARLNVQSNDEAGVVARWFDHFVVKLEAMVQTLVRSASGVTQASKDLTRIMEGSLHSMKEVAQEVAQVRNAVVANADHVHSTTAGIQQISGTAQIIAGVGQAAAMLSMDARTSAEQGQTAATDLIQSSQDLVLATNEVAGTVAELQQLSGKIEEIVQLISRFAAQTNLLSLNAAIEAARAGEQGRGFAVVAEEVRKLADGSANAADEIGSIVGLILHKTNDVVRAMAHAQRKVDEGSAKSELIRQGIQGIAMRIEQVGDKIEDIAAATEQQSASIQEIARTMERISENSFSSAENAGNIDVQVQRQLSNLDTLHKTSQHLEQLADDLGGVAVQFKVSAPPPEPPHEPSSESKVPSDVARWEASAARGATLLVSGGTVPPKP